MTGEATSGPGLRPPPGPCAGAGPDRPAPRRSDRPRRGSAIPGSGVGGSPRPARGPRATRRSGDARCGCPDGDAPGPRSLRVWPARRRNTPAPNGTSTSRRSGRWRVRTARASTSTMRTSPLSFAVAASSTPLTRISGTSPATVDRLTPVSPERREHLLDVAQEERVGPDHQDALSLQREAVGVEQVGRPVQGHGGLPGTGPTLDHQDPRERGADDLILFALDRADDVAHVPGAGLAEGREQGTGATQHHALGEQALPGRAVGGSGLGHRQDGCPGRPRWVDEVLVLQPEHGATPHGQVAAAGQALGVEPGGSVEGLGHRRAPVDHQWLVVRARHRQTPDVERLAEQRAVFVVPVRESGRCARSRAPGRRCRVAPGGPGWCAPRCRARCETGRCRPCPGRGRLGASGAPRPACTPSRRRRD